MLPCHSLWLKEIRTGTEGKNLQSGQRSWGNNVLFVACSAYLPVSPRTTRQKMIAATVSWAHPHQSLIKKTPDKLVYRPVWPRFLCGGSFFSDCLDLYEVGKTKQHTSLLNSCRSALLQALVFSAFRGQWQTWLYWVGGGLGMNLIRAIFYFSNEKTNTSCWQPAPT